MVTVLPAGAVPSILGCVVVTDEFFTGLSIVMPDGLALSLAPPVGVSVGVKVMELVGVGVGALPPVIVIVEGIELVNAFVLPSLSAPTKVSDENRTAIGDDVAARALNLIVATVPVPVMGVVVLVAPSAIETVPLPTVPDERIFGNIVPLWINSA